MGQPYRRQMETNWSAMCDNVSSGRNARSRLRAECALSMQFEQSSLSVWRKLVFQNAPRDDSVLCSLSWLLAGRTCPKLRFDRFRLNVVDGDQWAKLFLLQLWVFSIVYIYNNSLALYFTSFLFIIFFFLIFLFLWGWGGGFGYLHVWCVWVHARARACGRVCVFNYLKWCSLIR